MQDSASNVQRLLERLKAEQDSLERWQIIYDLTQLDAEQSLISLLAIAQERSLPDSNRVLAMSFIHSDSDQAADALFTLMTDTTEPVAVRADAAERLAGIVRPHMVPHYIAALRHESAEMRFWVSYGLVHMAPFVDISAALPNLDRVVAHDHAVLPGWWAVSSEALPALMHLLYTRHVPLVSDDDDCGCGPRVVLISPLFEYRDYQMTCQQLRETQPDATFQQHTTLNLDPAEFSAHILQRWSNARLNVLDPAPQALRLTWEIDMSHGVLLGGLHRDGYSVVLTGDDEDDMIQFTRWYRGIVPQEHILRWYDWADAGRVISADGIALDD